MTSMSYNYLVGLTTVSNIIAETCSAIWNILSPLVLKPCGKEDWKEIARTFEERWQFPHCIGALDGKHVIIQVLSLFIDKYYDDFFFIQNTYL